MQKNPVNFQEVIKLTALAVDPKSFKFGVTNFESDKYISIKDLSAVNFPNFHHFSIFLYFIFLFFGLFAHFKPEKPFFFKPH